MSTYRAPASAVTTSQWTCTVCQLSALPVTGPSAADETALLATVHDRVHHGGARTAELLAGAVRVA